MIKALELFAAFASHPVPPDQLIERWGLTTRRNAAFGDLSGGQRLFIALAFANDPRVVFLDELTQVSIHRPAAQPGSWSARSATAVERWCW